MKILSSLFYKRKSLFCLALAAMFLLLTVPGCAPVGTPAAAEPVQSMQEAEPAPAPAPQTPATAHEAEAEPPLLFPFRNIRWGMSQQEIAALEGQEPALSDRSPENDLHFDIYDSIDVLGIPMTFIYIFFSLYT